MPKIRSDKAEPTIGIITALPEEYTAVKVLLNRTRPYVPGGKGVGRQYLVGELAAPNDDRHCVVLTLADKGNNIAAARAAILLEHFPSIDTLIMIGIGGGIPCPEKPEEHVRLGDIVVSDNRGVIRYSFISDEPKEIKQGNLPKPPSPRLLEAVRLLEAAEIEGKHPWWKLIDRSLKKLAIKRPSKETDILTSSTDQGKIIDHPSDPKRTEDRPRVFIGPIASADEVLRDPQKRDKLRERYGVKAVEMEGSGIADATWDQEAGYLVIRGICDYCDSRKNNVWHNYAAIVAAAYMRALLEQTPLQTQPKRAKLYPTGKSRSTSARRLEVVHSKDSTNIPQNLDFDRLMEVCKNQVRNEIRHLKGSTKEMEKKYIPELYVTRTEIETEFEEFLHQCEKNACVVVGEAGIGKTNLLCHLSQKSASKRPIIFLNSMYLNGPLENKITNIFAEAVGPNVGFDRLIAHINVLLRQKNLDLIVFLDAINESIDPITMKTDLAAFVHKNLDNRMKFYISCRDMDWEFFLKNNDMFMDCLYSKKGRVFLKNDIKFDEFSEKEFSEAWKLYRAMYSLKGTLSKVVKQICRHPLMLRFLAEGFQEQKLPKDIRRIEIFDQYWLRKLEHTGREDRATDYMFKIVQELKKREKHDLLKTEIVKLSGDTTEDPQTVLSKILSEDLITYLNWHGDRVVGFSYEAFFEYVMARWIIYGDEYCWNRKNKANILADLAKFVEEVKRYRTMKGTIQYLVMMMEGRKNDIQVPMIDVLLHTGEPVWESFIINVSNKLKNPEKIIGAIGQLAEKGDMRVFAVRALGDIGTEKATQFLDAPLKDEDFEISHEAAISLSRIGSVSAIKILTSALAETANVALRYSIVNMLSKIKDHDVTEILLEMATRSDVYTKKYITEIFGKSRDPRVVEFLLNMTCDSDEAIVTSAIEALGNIVSSNEETWTIWNERITDRLIELLSHENEWIVANAIEAIASLGNEKAITPLLHLLRNKNRFVQRRAIEALAVVGGEKTILPIIDLMNDNEEFVRQNAIVAIGIIGGKKAIETLVETLCKREMKNRKCIHDSFRTIGIDGSLSVLQETLEKGNCKNLTYLIEAIGALQSPAGISPLLEFLAKHRHEYTVEIINALATIGGEKAVKVLLGMLQPESDEEEYLVLDVIDALGRMKAKEALMSLTEFIKDDKSMECVQSIVAIGKIKNLSSSDTLIAALHFKDPKARCAAVTALGMIGGEAAVKPLINSLNDEEANVRISATDSLGQIKSSLAVVPLLKRFSLENEVKEGSQIENTDARYKTREWYDQEQKRELTKLTIVRALGEIGSAASVPLLSDILERALQSINTYLTSPSNTRSPWEIRRLDWELWREAIIALGKIGSIKATPILTRLLEEYVVLREDEWNPIAEYRLEVMEALAKIGDTDAVNVLIDALKKPLQRHSGANADIRDKYETRIRKAVRDALMRISDTESRI